MKTIYINPVRYIATALFLGIILLSTCAPSFAQQGRSTPPVSIYPTIVTGGTINLNAALPIEKMVVVSTNGVQVFTKDLNGQQGHIPIVIPSLSKGIYFISFQGAGWKTTEKFIIP